MERLLHAHTHARLTNERKVTTLLRAAEVDYRSAIEDWRLSSEWWESAYKRADKGRRRWKTICFGAAAIFTGFIIAK